MLDQTDMLYIEEKRKSLIAEMKSTHRSDGFSVSRRSAVTRHRVRLRTTPSATDAKERQIDRRYRREIREELTAIVRHTVRLIRVLRGAGRSTRVEV